MAQFLVKTVNCGLPEAPELYDALNHSKSLESGILQCVNASLPITAQAIVHARAATSAPICETDVSTWNDLSHI